MVDENDTEKEHNEPSEHEDEFAEEFEFEPTSEEEPLEHEEFEGEEAPAIEEPVQRKNAAIPLVIGIVVVGFIGWKIYSWISKPKPAPVEIAETAPPKVVAPPVKKVEPPPGPSIEEQARMAEAAKTSALDENISSLQKKIDAQDQLYKQQISQLEKSLGTAAQNSSDMTKNLSTLQHDVATLSAAVQDLSTQLKAIREDQVNALAKLEEMEKRKTAKPKSSKITKGEAFTSPNLSVYAIIPGRAWLRTPDGKTMTVTEGDNVGEYGKVLKIDAPNGVVITSSGVALR